MDKQSNSELQPALIAGDAAEIAAAGTVIGTTACKATCITGSVSTGKTQTLINRAQTLLAQGASHNSLVIFCATEDAAHVFRARLAQTLGENLAPFEQNIPFEQPGRLRRLPLLAQQPGLPLITTPQAFSLALLATEQAQDFTGRSPRLLANFEVNFLLEDLKTSGIRPRRLREMFDFFCRSWTELASDNPNWLVSGEERLVHRLIEEHLTFTGGILHAELSNLCVRYLRHAHDALKNATVLHVLIDDYQNLNRASQTLLTLIAGESLTLAGDPDACVQVADPHPFAKGIDEFIGANPQCERVQLTKSSLPPAITDAAVRLAGGTLPSAPVSYTEENDSDHTPTAKVCIQNYSSIGDELEGILRAVRSYANAGKSLSDLYIATPHMVWNNRIAAALKSWGYAVDSVPNIQLLRGDIRDNARCVALRVFTALLLVDNPDDGVAWRSWCGFGDYLAKSGEFENLCTYAKTKALRVPASLKSIAQDAQARTEYPALIAAYENALALRERVQGLAGRTLLAALTAAITEDTPTASPEGTQEVAIPEELLALCHPLRERDTPQEMALRARANLMFPHFSHEAHAIKVGPLHGLCGLSPYMVLLSGFVNGFIPAREYFDEAATTPVKRERILQESTHLARACRGKAREELVVTTFAKIGLEDAERLKLEIERVRLEKGERISVIAPSLLLKVLKQNE